IDMKTISILLFAEAVLGARLTQHRRQNHAKRALSRTSGPRRVDGLTNTTNTAYSDNWAGAVITTTDVSEVTAIITVPSVSAPSGSSSSEYCASAWVGIDGNSCETAILQTGVDFCYEHGSPSYDAWYEWYPDYSYDFDLTVSEGDVLKLSVTATSDTSGTAVIENQTTGKSVTKTFSGNVQGDLCRTDAEWIVEDFEEGSSLVAFADFGTVAFSSATATAGGGTLSPDSGSTIDIRQNNQVLTSCSTSNDAVTCTYE
ncbi:hypothetical protein M406DRAFT_35581, partial [Cryphonectria parasitica EP155]